MGIEDFHDRQDYVPGMRYHQLRYIPACLSIYKHFYVCYRGQVLLLHLYQYGISWQLGQNGETQRPQRVQTL